MDLLEEEDTDEVDDRLPLSVNPSQRKSTLFLKSFIHRNKNYLQKEQKDITVKRDNHEILMPLDLTWNSSPLRGLHRPPRRRRTSLTVVSPSRLEYTENKKRSLSVPYVKTPLRSASDTLAADQSSVCETDEAHENKVAEETENVEESREGQSPHDDITLFRHQDSTTQTDVILHLDEMLLSYEMLPPEDQSTQTSSELPGAISIGTSTSSIRKYDKVPFYQRKLISWGLSEIFAANLCHPYQAFRRYPGFTREELLALQCVLYIWGVILVVAGVSFYLVI